VLLHDILLYINVHVLETHTLYSYIKVACLKCIWTYAKYCLHWWNSLILSCKKIKRHANKKCMLNSNVFISCNKLKCPINRKIPKAVVSSCFKQKPHARLSCGIKQSKKEKTGGQKAKPQTLLPPLQFVLCLSLIIMWFQVASVKHKNKYVNVYIIYCT